MVTAALRTLVDALDECLLAFGVAIRDPGHPQSQFPNATTIEETLTDRIVSAPGAPASLAQVKDEITAVHGTHGAIEALAGEATGARIQVLLNGTTLFTLRSAEAPTETYRAFHTSRFDPGDMVQVRAVLDKRDFLDGLGADQNSHCFVSGSFLHDFLGSPLSDLSTLWPARGGSGPNTDMALIHTVSSVTFDGQLLQIGDSIASTASSNATAATLASRFQHHAASIATSTLNLAGLTPTHLARRAATEGEPKELHRHLTKLALIHMCDIARGSDNETTVAFRSGNLHASLEVPADATTGYPDELARLCNWVYQPPADAGAADPFHDRLAVAQTVLARDLQPVEKDRRLAFLLGSERQLYAETLESWKSYVSDKIDAHTTKRIELENDVAAAVADFGARTDGMVSELTKAMAGVVAAIISSFLGAAFSDKFNADIFRIGLGAYLAYLLVFPAAIGLTVYRSRQTASEADLDARIVTFIGALGRDKVNEVVGKRVEGAKSRFSTAFWVAIAAYALVFIVGVIALFIVPDIVSGDADTPAGAQTATGAGSAPTRRIALPCELRGEANFGRTHLRRTLEGSGPNDLHLIDDLEPLTYDLDHRVGSHPRTVPPNVRPTSSRTIPEGAAVGHPISRWDTGPSELAARLRPKCSAR